MSDRLACLMKPNLYRLWVSQISLCLLLGVVFYFTLPITAAYSALLGGLIYIFTNVYFAKKVFTVVGASQLKKIVNNVYRAEALKILMTAILFGLSFYLLPISGWSFLTGYIAMQITVWFAPLIFK